MSKDAKEDKARRIRRKQDSLWVHADRDNIRENRRNCSGDGSESQRSDREDFSRNEGREATADFGKILSQLEEIREAHLAYLNAHTDRLRARLAEDDEHRQKLINDMDKLREAIILKMQLNASDEEG